MNCKLGLVVLILLIDSLVGMTCSEPVVISDLRDNAMLPSVSVNARGDAAVAWIGTVRFRESIQVAHKNFEELWLVPETVSEEREFGFMQPISFLSDLGDLYVLYNDTDPNLMRLIEKPNHRSWSDPVLLSMQNWGAWSWKFDRNGRLFYLNDRDDSNRWLTRALCSVQLNIKQPTVSEQQVYAPSAAGHSVLDGDSSTLGMALGMNQTGDVFVVWKKGLKETSLRGNWLLPYGSFAEIEEVSNQVSILDHYLSGIVIDEQKNVTLVGVKDAKVQVLSRVDGHWSDWTCMSNEANIKGTWKMPLPQIAIDCDGNVLVVWKTEKEGETWIEASYKRFGQEWIPLKEIVLQGKVETVILRSDKYDHFALVWDEKKDRQISGVYGAKFTNGVGKWSEVVQLSPQNAYCLEPSLEFSQNGTGVLAWTKKGSTFESCIEAVDICLD